jgi:hypothetical protein
MDTLTVLDTDVFIDHFRGLAAATAYIQRLLVVQRATTEQHFCAPQARPFVHCDTEKARALTSRRNRSQRLIFPQLPPPFLWSCRGAIARHFFPDILDIPASQRSERPRLLLPALQEMSAVFLCLATRLCPLPGVTQDVAALEVGTVGGLLERQILGEMGSVIAQV